MRLFLLLLLLPFSMQAQSNFVRDIDAGGGDTIVRGSCTFGELIADPSSGWMQTKTNYKPDRNDVKYLRKNLPDFKIVILFGSWCPDTHEQLPRFYSILKSAKMPLDKVQLVGFDRNKRGRDMEHKIFKVERLPTFIVYKGHKEIGRIVETPTVTLEADLVKIITPAEEGK